MVKKSLMIIPERCSNKHIQCEMIIESIKKNEIEIDDEYINDYIRMLLGVNMYVNCFIKNNNRGDIIEYIMEKSKNVEIDEEYLGGLLLLLDDEDAIEMIKRQKKLNKNLRVVKLRLYYYDEEYMMGNIVNYSRYKLGRYIIENMDKDDLLYIINNNNIFNRFSQGEEINKMVSKNIKNMMDEMTKEEISKVINKYIYKNVILSEIIKNYSNKIEDISIIEKCYKIGLMDLDAKLILIILEEYKIKIKIEDVDNMAKDNYTHRNNKKRFAEVLDVLIRYGLQVDKNLIIKLLEREYYINNIAKYNIEIDLEILSKMSEKNYYPYEYNCIPDEKVLNIESKKYGNIEMIKYMKERGGKYNINHLINACGIRNNSKVIKFMINECGVKPTEEAIESFEEINNIDGLKCLLDNYEKNEKIISKEEERIEINDEILLNIAKRDKDFKENKSYEINSSIKKFFKLRKKEYNLIEINKIFMEYLINNNLVISRYFIIDKPLSNLLKIDFSRIIHIDNISNITCYFFN